MTEGGGKRVLSNCCLTHSVKNFTTKLQRGFGRSGQRPLEVYQIFNMFFPKRMSIMHAVCPRQRVVMNGCDSKAPQLETVGPELLPRRASSGSVQTSRRASCSKVLTFKHSGDSTGCGTTPLCHSQPEASDVIDMFLEHLCM